jgi:hypothetical protein
MVHTEEDFKNEGQIAYMYENKLKTRGPLQIWKKLAGWQS